MAVASATTILVFLYTLPFCIIALHSLKKYLSDKQSSEKKHVFYAFLCFSAAFISSSIASVLVLPDMSPERLIIVKIFFKLFDIINMIGVFWLFVFLADFTKNMKKYIPFVAVHLAITLIVIIVMPFGINIIEGAEYVRDRAEVTSLAILFFWFLYWGIIAYQFWKHSKLMKKKVSMRRSQTMSIGGVFAVLAYICAVLSNIAFSIILVYVAAFCGVTAGIVFYAGFIAPECFRRRWEK